MIFVFIPQIFFMLLLFGYMDILIFIKWNTDYQGIENQAPDIKSYLMSIVLNFGTLQDAPEKGKDWILLSSREFTERLHIIILFLSILCLVLMFLPKIIINYSKAKQKESLINNKGPKINNNNIDDLEEDIIPMAQNNNDEVRLSDFIVASVIETIEFALGTVSNTASYLRLWALSLAHSQLSAVFFRYSIGLMSMMTGYFFVNGILLSMVFLVYACVIFGVLLCMDFMECCLHTLRLHWVEFQNKFYKADGYKFQPFCFELEIELNSELIS